MAKIVLSIDQGHGPDMDAISLCVDGKREPVIHKKIDGPMLVTSDGGVHFLTPLERLQLFVGYTTIRDINRKIVDQRKLASKKS